MFSMRIHGPRAGVALPAILLMTLSATPLMAQDKSTTYDGKAIPIGNGKAHTVVRTGANGQLQSIGIVFTEDMLNGLPVAAKKSVPGGFAYALPMPTSGPKTVVDHVVINWESTGHPPPKVYDVPHFDFHFYLVSSKERMHTRYRSAAESGSPAQRPAPQFMAASYVLPPGTAVSRMGVHAINPEATEFKGQPFTATFIYGYHDKRQAFLEPMASLSFLQSKTPFRATIPRPASYSKAGLYPSSYSIQYDASSKTYAVMLDDLQ